VEPLEFCEQSVISDNSANQTWMIASVCNVKSQFPEGFRTKTERTVNIPFGRRRFSGVRFIAIDEENLPGGGCM